VAGKSPGRRDLNAKRFPTIIDPKPQERAKPVHRRMVGSSRTASAVLGFSMMKAIPGSEASHSRVSRYL
jgi:hypothetical protein